MPSSQALGTEAAIADVVHAALGARVAVARVGWYVRGEHYVAASVQTRSPAMRLVVKLAVDGDRPGRDFGTMAAIAGRVRAETLVPTFDVVAVDSTQAKVPWRYLVVTELPGETWSVLYPALDAQTRAPAQRQIGRAAAQINALSFDTFGPIGGDGRVAIRSGSAVAALARRAHERLRTPRFLDAVLELLDARGASFEGLKAARLTHEDLNPYNLLFVVRDGLLELSGVLDFESAWAGVAESDLARLELWRYTGGNAVRDGYAEITRIDTGYLQRRPVLQLLWCLEFAEAQPTAQHQADTDQVCAELGIPPIPLA
jgi:aminoglycoside phosphotransferase (APT) family kinase protein